MLLDVFACVCFFVALAKYVRSIKHHGRHFVRRISTLLLNAKTSWLAGEVWWLLLMYDVRCELNASRAITLYISNMQIYGIPFGVTFDYFICIGWSQPWMREYIYIVINIFIWDIHFSFTFKDFIAKKITLKTLCLRLCSVSMAIWIMRERIKTENNRLKREAEK